MADPVAGVDVFTFIGENADAALQTFVVDLSRRIVAYLTPVVLASVTLYILILGYQVMMGKGSFENFASIALRILVVVGITGEYVYYDQYIVQGYRAAETWLMSAVQLFDPDSVGTVYGKLDGALIKAFDISNKIQEEKPEIGTFGGGIGTVFLLLICQLIVLASIGLMTLMGGLIVVAAKIAITSLLAVGPIFIFLFMFPVTTRFATAWLTQLWNYTFQMFFVILFITLGLTVGESYMSGFEIGERDDGTSLNIFLSASQLLFVSCVIYGLLRQASGLAGAIAGGTSINPTSLTAVAQSVQNAATGAKNTMNAVTSPGRAAKNYLNKESTRKDSDGNEHTASRKAHIVSGRSIANKQYLKTLGHNRQQTGKVSKSSGSSGAAKQSNKYKY